MATHDKCEQQVVIAGERRLKRVGETKGLMKRMPPTLLVTNICLQLLPPSDLGIK